MNEKTLIITRSVSGAGKSTFTEFLKCYVANSIEINADSYMYEGGQYVFRPEKLGMAHNACRIKFDKAVDDKVSLIIVSNTSTKFSDFSYYLEKGQKSGYIVHVMVLERYHEGINEHGVPESTLQKQEQNIKSSLKLR